MRRVPYALFVLLCIGWYAYTGVYRLFPGDSPSDFSWTYAASRYILHGESPYRSEGYLYSPLLAFSLAPLAKFSYVTARRIWFGCSQLAMGIAAFLLWKRLGRSWRAACAIAAVWAFGGAAEESIGLGQPGPFLLLLVVVGLFAGKLRDAAIACGAVLKFLPAALIVPLALAKDWRACLRVGWWAAALAGLGAIGLLTLDGPKAPKSVGFLAGTPAILSWSVPSIALRTLEAPPAAASLPDTWIHGNTLQTLELPARDRVLAVAMGAAVLLLGLVYLSRYRPDVFTGVGAIALALAVSPVCWSHYRILEYTGIAMLINRSWSERLWLRFAATVLIGLCMYPLPVATLRHLYERNSGWPQAPALLLLLTSVPTAADLCCLLLSSTFSERRVRQAA